MKIALTGGDIITPFRIIKKGTLIIGNRKISELGKSTDKSFLKNCKVISEFFDIRLHQK